jgi:adenylate kinase family enzyme
LRDYQKRTLPVVRFYQKQKLLVKINGAQSITAVYRDIVKALTKKIRSG